MYNEDMKKEKAKKIIGRAFSILVVLGVVLFLAYYLFNAYVGTDKIMQDFQEWVSKNVFLACLAYLVLTPLINIIPGISSIFFITLANMMLNDNTIPGMFKSFGLAAGGVMLSTIFLFLLGRWGGKKAMSWVIGEEELKKAEKILTYGGKASLPFVYLFPLFPDDTISFLCGMTKMSFTYNTVCALIFRSIGVFVICFFGTNLIDYSKFAPWQWVLLVIGSILLGLLVLFLIKIYYGYLRYKEEGKCYLLTKGLDRSFKKDQKSK